MWHTRASPDEHYAVFRGMPAGVGPVLAIQEFRRASLSGPVSNSPVARQTTGQVLGILLAVGVGLSGQSVGRLGLAVRQDPIKLVLDAFATHAVVALGEGPHNNLAGHAFRLALIREPGFADVVDDIVVEFGSATQQGVIDRYVRGEPVPLSELRHVWEDTTAVGPVWDTPIYAEFFEAVRALNATSPPERRLRVLLGDAPIDWSNTRTRADVRRAGLQKGPHMAALVRREVIAKQRRALMIYGDSHFTGRTLSDPKAAFNRIERMPGGTRVFTIHSTYTDLLAWQPDAATWTLPAAFTTKGTTTGARPLAQFLPIPPAPGWNRLTMTSQFDAIIVLGRPGELKMAALTAGRCADQSYMQMRLARMALNVEQVRRTSIYNLKQICAARLRDAGNGAGLVSRLSLPTQHVLRGVIIQDVRLAHPPE